MRAQRARRRGPGAGACPCERKAQNIISRTLVYSLHSFQYATALCDHVSSCVHVMLHRVRHAQRKKVRECQHDKLMAAQTNCRLICVQIVAGLDEGLLSMKPGGLRRMYIPGQLAYPKGLPSGPGRYVVTYIW